MNEPSHPEIPDFATLAADPEIAPLLAFEPVVRKVQRPDGWTPELRQWQARIALLRRLDLAQGGSSEWPDVGAGAPGE